MHHSNLKQLQRLQISADLQEELVRLGAEASLLTGSDGHDETSTLLAQGEGWFKLVLARVYFGFD